MAAYPVQERGRKDTQKFNLFDDFLSQTQIEADGPWIENSTGDANDPAIAATAEGGAIAITSSANNNEVSQLVCSVPVQADSGSLWFECRLKNVTDVANVCINAGFTDITTLQTAVTISTTTVTTTAVNACMFVYDTNQTTDRWYVIGVDGNTDATGNGITTSTPVADVYQTLRIEISSDGERADFYIDGVSVGTLTAAAITASTNVFATVSVTNRSGAANTVHVDYLAFGHDRD